MNEKFKWFKISPFNPSHLKILIGKLQADSYSDENGRGFVVDEVRSRSATFRYIERNNITETIQSPLGGHTDYQLITYNQCAFDLSLDWPLCEIHSGFRSATKVLNLLASHLDFGIVIEEQSIQLEKLLSTLKLDTQDMQILSVTVTDLQVDGHTSARVEISSTQDAYTRIQTITQSRPYHLSHVKFRWYINGRECVASLSSDGRCSLVAYEHKIASLYLKKIVAATVVQSD